MFVVDSVFVEPVIDVGFEVDVISEIAWSGGSDEKSVLVRDGMVDV